ncbi:MAG: oligosaccharide flippase family protein [Candidatus Thiodiazotropha sp. (ex Dulcina madagascariensis)]|nr:oligosaccharide flippase family protein [Candidatus Thiodiazotropha sp. (ex Dulcina madagascariensis)]MCU7926453.1 oligosaccharide flippase family protein [Candidatus Thiodiazotropha sp. (ex Dulcina madagascariensis)]
MKTIKKLLSSKASGSIIDRVVKNSSIILAGNSTASALNLISFTLMANQIGPEFLAILVLCQTYALIYNDLFNIQTWESMIKYGNTQNKSFTVKDIIFTNMFLDVASAIIAFSLAYSLALSTAQLFDWDNSYVEYIALYSVTILFNITTFTIGIPRFFNKFSVVSKVFVATALLKLIAILIARGTDQAFVTYIYIYLVIEVITNVSLVLYSLKLLASKYGGDWWIRKLKINKDQIRFLWWTNLRTIIRIPVRHFDMIVISAVMPMATLGVYKVYKEFAGLITRIGEPVNQALYPEFTKLIGNSNSEESIDITKRAMRLLSLVGLAMGVVFMLASNSVIEHFFGTEYTSSIAALYLMIVLYILSFITVPINSLFIAAGFAKYSVYLLLFTNSIYLLSAFGFGQLYGIYGVIIAFAIQLFFNKGLKVFLMMKHSKDWDTVVR